MEMRSKGGGEYEGDVEEKSKIGFLSLTLTGYYREAVSKMALISDIFINKAEGLFILIKSDLISCLKSN